MKPRAIEVQIDELVLHGFEAGAHRQIGDAIQEELERLLANGQAAEGFDSNGSIDRLAAAPVRFSNQDHVLGGDVARSVYRALANHQPERLP